MLYTREWEIFPAASIRIHNNGENIRLWRQRGTSILDITEEGRTPKICFETFT